MSDTEDNDGPLPTYLASRAWGAATPDGRMALCFELDGGQQIAIQLQPDMVLHLQDTLSELQTYSLRKPGRA
jgi:hypothetical protein